jgi:Tfp pilus assembly protein PilN
VIGGVVGTVLVTAVLAAMFLTASTGVADNQERHDAAEAQLAATPVPPPAVPGASELEQEKSARIGALSAALSGRLAWDRVLREVSLVLPDDVWLSSLSATAPVGASPTTAAGFAVNGKTYSHDGVARLLARLSVVPHLSNVQLLHSSAATTETGRKVVEFSINATVKGAGA